MIHPNELRIGNWVEFFKDDLGKVLKIDSLSVYDNVYLECDESFEWTEFKNLEPILLTADMLEKQLGAKNDGSNYILNVGALKMKFRHYSEWYSELGDIYLGSNIQYLHQLQNLYFALMGKELKVERSVASKETSGNE